MYKIVIMTCLGLLVGCANAELPSAAVKCSGENWKELGAQAAKELKPIRAFDVYIKNCGSRLDPGAKAAFIDGYARTIVDLCTFKNGYDLGLANNEYPEVCPVEIQSEFQKGYVVGKREYQDKMRNMKRMSDEREQRQSMDDMRAKPAEPQ